MALLALGQFVFSTDTLTFSELQRKRGWSLGSNTVAQGRNQYQYTGAAEETISIPYRIYESHGFGTRQAVDDLAEMGSTGAGYVLIDGSGYIYGVFAIASIDDTRSVLVSSGVPRKIDGTLNLVRVDDSRIQSDKQTNAGVGTESSS